MITTTTTLKSMPKPIWDIFCNVIDNWGDIGVCWRLSQQLSVAGIHVRLWIDDPTALNWMRSPSDLPIEIVHWTTHAPLLTAEQAFIEAFGCHAPDSFLQSAADKTQTGSPPVWINLEYLSAQPHVERLHGLPSIQHYGPAQGMTRWFFHPGFTAKTGGLLREADLAERQQRFDTYSWLENQKITVQSDALRISLFHYPNHALPHLLEQWMHSSVPVHLLATPGHTTEQIRTLPSVCSTIHINQPPQTTRHGQLSITFLTYLTQKDFDHLLWSSDLNMIRGEDSWIRALWANKPMIWQPYIQEDEEHLNKLDAFMAHIPKAPVAWQQFQKQWNLQASPDWSKLLDALPDIQKAISAFTLTLKQQPDLCSSLINFVRQKHENINANLNAGKYKTALS